jgi:hypothetical protein
VLLEIASGDEQHVVPRARRRCDRCRVGPARGDDDRRAVVARIEGDRGLRDRQMDARAKRQLRAGTARGAGRGDSVAEEEEAPGITDRLVQGLGLR